jgi:hypothetical protein
MISLLLIFETLRVGVGAPIFIFISLDYKVNTVLAIALIKIYDREWQYFQSQ